jgi:dipeptidyl aminopeptidase/acylaminoacyl peptidase
MRSASAAAFAMMLGLAATAEAQGTRKLTLEMSLEMESVGDAQFSPDGKEIIFSRRAVDKVNDRRSSSVWIMDADGGRQRVLLTGGSSPEWSPDGSSLAYLKRGDSGSQIFVRRMAGDSSETQVTKVKGTPASFSWSADGKSIAFVMPVPVAQTTEQEWAVNLPGKPANAKWTPDPRIVDRLVWQADGQGFLEEEFRHVFVVPATGGEHVQLTSGDWDHDNATWAPDGRTILFTSNRVPGAEFMWRESEIYAVDVATKRIRPLTTRKGTDSEPTISPDGRLVAYTGYDVSDNTRTETKLYVMNIDGSDSRVLTPTLDRTPENLTWAHDGSGVYVTVQSEGAINLYFAPLNGAVRQVTRGAHLLSVSDILPNGQAVGTLSTPNKPADIVTLDLRTPDRIRQLTAVNDDVLKNVKLGEVEEIWYKSVDDWRVQGWIIKPPDFDSSKKYPMILAIHGGPHAMYNVGFNFAMQEHAANGYVVLYTNPRGSTGYGEKFAAAISNAFPDKDFHDLMAGVDTVVGRGYVDPKNLFAYGCSGGGVLSSWTVTQTDRFAAAVVMCPIVNWITFAGTVDDPRRSSYMGNFAKWPWEDPAPYLARSPLMHVGKVKTPTMLMTGVRDLRTPISQSEEFYRALKVRGVPTVLVRMNDEWHGTSSKPSNFMRTQLLQRRWFEKFER